MKKYISQWHKISGRYQLHIVEWYDSYSNLSNDISFVTVRLSFSKLLAKAKNWSVTGIHPDAVRFEWSTKGYQWWNVFYDESFFFNPVCMVQYKMCGFFVASALLKHVTVIFRSMKASRLFLRWIQFPQTLYVWILMWKIWFVFFPEIFVRHKCLVFSLCVCTCTNLLVLNTEAKKMLCI